VEEACPDRFSRCPLEPAIASQSLGDRASAALQELPVSAVKGRSFTISNPPLTTVERYALEHCVDQARSGRPVTQMTISAAIGSHNVAGSTAAGVLNRLEAKGYITRQAFQRGVQVCIVESGLCTAPPPCTVPHWRAITERVPTPAIHHLRQRDMTAAQWIETEARRIGRDHLDFLQELVRRGMQDYKADQESPP
jgi:hypothetical protein